MNMDGIRISDLKDGLICDGTYLIKTAEAKKTAAGKTYVDMTLIDKTGSINAKNWNGNENTVAKLKIGSLYSFNSRVTLWQGSLQLSINSIRRADQETQNRIDEFVPSAPISSDEMFKIVAEYIGKIQNEDMKKLVTSIYSDKKEKLRYYPAAKALHHSIMGGLLYHITTMCRLGEKIASVYTNVDTDLLYTGILLHDIMKTEEMNSNEIGIADYSIKGQLMGHIELGVCLVDQKARELQIDDEVAMLIKHMIISHHSEAEYGSPKKPMFLEAELLHQIDVIDARVYDFEQHYQSLEKGNVTDNIWSLDRRIYKPNI